MCGLQPPRGVRRYEVLLLRTGSPSNLRRVRSRQLQGTWHNDGSPLPYDGGFQVRMQGLPESFPESFDRGPFGLALARPFLDNINRRGRERKSSQRSCRETAPSGCNALRAAIVLGTFYGESPAPAGIRACRCGPRHFHNRQALACQCPRRCIIPRYHFPSLPSHCCSTLCVLCRTESMLRYLSWAGRGSSSFHDQDSGQKVWPV